MKKFIFIVIIVMSLISITKVLGLAIAPARTTLEYKKGYQEGYIRIISEELPIKIVLTKEGELGKYIELEKETFILENQETIIKFKINLPEDLPPGERAGAILVLQIPKESLQNNVVLATTAFVHQIRVNVPYPGKYLTSNLYITNLKVKEPILFTFATKNFGKEKIENAKVNLIIKGPTNQELAKIESEKKSIESEKEEQFLLTWITENAGSYFAEATIEYDGKVYQISQKFDVGNLELEIEKIEVNDFKIGQIAKIDIYLRNKWNKEIKTEGKIDIFKNNKKIASINTIPLSVLEKSTAVMNGFWDTQGIELGEYDLSVKVSYEGKSSEKTYTAYVAADSVNFKDFSVGKVISQKNNNSNMLIFAVVILIILNIILIIFVIKKIKK